MNSEKGIIEGWFYGDGSWGRHQDHTIQSCQLKTKDIQDALLFRYLLSAFDTPAMITRTFSKLAGKTFPGHLVTVSIGGVVTLIRSHGIALRKGLSPVPDVLGPECRRAYFPTAVRVLDGNIAYLVIDVEHDADRGDTLAAMATEVQQHVVI